MMNCSPEELAQTSRLEKSYIQGQSATMLSIEKSVCGCQYGGTSWTTRRQADVLAEKLALRPGRRLLDLGAGSGWPGLYLSTGSGCEVTLVDLPLSGLKIARSRASKDGIADRVSTVNASATQLPFSPDSFDAISHSDLLCCLIDKKSVLSACRKVVKPNGLMAFTVISIPEQLTDAQRQKALESGPEFTGSDEPYSTMLQDTGWLIQEERDLTFEFAEVVERQIAADLSYHQHLTELLTGAEMEERRIMWQDKTAAIRDGLLKRKMFVARPIN